MRTDKIIKVIIPQQVKVRKYSVDVEKLKVLLKKYKVKSKLSNKEIAESLKQPKTLVDHWFRSDSSFSIPSEDIWYELKELLEIREKDFDKSITTYEIRDGVYDKSNRVYDANGIAPTLTCANTENERYIIYDK